MQKRFAIPHPGHPLIAKKLWKVPVVVHVNDTAMCETAAKAEFWLIAKSPADAANWVRDQLSFLPNTEVWAWGPKGGAYYRFVGYESAISSQMFGHEVSDAEKRERINLIFGEQ
jgi:hypothetical protein